MLKLNVFIVLALYSGTLLGQNLVSTAGETSSSENLEIAWSVGEIATLSSTLDKAIFTEGYHQPILLVKEVKSRSGSDSRYNGQDLWIMTYPNPSNDRLCIERVLSDAVFLSCLVTDTGGKVVSSFDITEGTLKYELDVSTLKSGNYNLTCTSEKFNLQKSFLITVIH